MIKRIVTLIAALLLSQSVLAKQIVTGVDFIPQRNFSLQLTPLVLTDLISAKIALEYRLHSKFNLVFPLEAKWMDYRWAIKLGGQLLNIPENIPEYWYRPKAAIRPAWNIDYAHTHVSSGAGLKYFPFGESMQDAFYIKTLAMLGVSRFNAFSAEGERDSLTFTHVLTFGYNWVKGNVFTFGYEFGEEWTFYANPMDKMPRPFAGFTPILQFSLGFNI